jgi:hypothetical protein
MLYYVGENCSGYKICASFRFVCSFVQIILAAANILLVTKTHGGLRVKCHLLLSDLTKIRHF